MPFWYNLKTRSVETDENRSGGNDLLGPFATRHEAESALATSEAHGRAADAADAADAEWKNDDHSENS